MEPRAALLALALAACDSVFGLSRDPLPPDAAIDARLCSFSTQPPGGDPDADGVINRDDNCVMTPNASQHDEDHDCVGDACDNCAWFADIAQGDGDGDGIADACDFQPGTHNRFHFEPFADPQAFVNDWKHSGTYVVMNDELVQTVDAGQHWASLSNSKNLGHVEAAIALPPETVASDLPFEVGVTFYVSGQDPNATNHAWLAGIARDATGTWFRISYIVLGNRTIENQQKLLDTNAEEIPLTTAPFRVTATGNALAQNPIEATLDIGGQRFSLVSDLNGVGIGGEYFGVMTYGTRATFGHWVLQTN